MFTSQVSQDVVIEENVICCSIGNEAFMTRSMSTGSFGHSHRTHADSGPKYVYLGTDTDHATVHLFQIEYFDLVLLVPQNKLGIFMPFCYRPGGCGGWMPMYVVKNGPVASVSFNGKVMTFEWPKE